MNDEVYLHLHVNLSDSSCHAFGGHLNAAVVSATCEVVVCALEGEVGREFSEEIGLNLLQLP
jgi:predicted DNA-binding protein with PD1-like motif